MSTLRTAPSTLPALVASLGVTRAYPLDDGIWRVYWCGIPCAENFVTEQAALDYIADCNRAGRMI